MPGQNAARTMLKKFEMLDKSGRFAESKARRAREKELRENPWTNGQDDPWPAELLSN